MKKSLLIITAICLIGVSNTVYSQELKFLGVPFGTASKEFNHRLMDKGFTWVTGIDNTTNREYRGELKGDFWKVRDCEIYLKSFYNDYTKTFPITEAWVIIPTDGMQTDEFAKLYQELISDFEGKYGDFSEIKYPSDEIQTIWHLNNGDIFVETIMTFSIRIRYISSIRLRQIAEKNRFKGNGSSDL